MKYAFHVQSTFAAEIAMDLQKAEIVKQVVTMAEKLDLKENDYAIINVHVLDLKVVVQFQEREIHVMTKAEADAAGLPDK